VDHFPTQSPKMIGIVSVAALAAIAAVALPGVAITATRRRTLVDVAVPTDQHKNAR
jgi:hypothetical protein